MGSPTPPKQPFVLLDDARESGASGSRAADTRIYRDPVEVFAAYRPKDVERVLAEADTAQREGRGELAGYIAYEAGLALEPKLMKLAEARSGSAGPLVWLGLFESEPELLAPDEAAGWLAANSEGTASLGPLDPQLSPGGYDEAFATLQDAIHAGDIYQANLTYPLSGSYRGDPVALYAQLRASAKAGYGGLIFDGRHWLLSFSPELFVALEGDADGSWAKVKPMKGTRPRGSDEASDLALKEELATSVKDRAENLMIVDLMRNDLSRVAVPGSVRVDAPFAVESYPTVHQMVSSVRAQLAPGKGAMDMVRALFPCGSITGAPKIRAMELINEVERDSRGPYCGAMGRIGPSGSAAFNVAIRTFRLTPIENAQGTAALGVGSAIVADSDRLAERRECEVKAGFARASSSDLTAPAFDLIETMEFNPEIGIALLELHLERMKKSAAELGFEFDRHAARNQIQALCFELEAPAKLRLLTARSGATALETAPLPEPFEDDVPVIALPHPLDPSDWRLAHKTSDRGFYDDGLAAAQAMGAKEAILVREDGLVTEGCWTNVFVERDGVLLTPPTTLGLLPGVLRAFLIEKGQAKEAELTLDDLADGFQLGNAVRGLARLTRNDMNTPDILFEDGEALVINKPAGLPIDRPRKGGECLEDHLEALKLGFQRAPMAVHRLDTDTSGCLLLARNPKALKRFNKAFEDRLVTKTYLAVLAGHPPQASGTIRLKLAKISSEAKGWRMIAAKKGKEAVSHWELVQELGAHCVIRFTPETGRTHQLRIHAHKGLGAPLLGDPVYGSEGQRGKGAKRTMLHASSLMVPREGKPAIEAHAPLPSEFTAMGVTAPHAPEPEVDG